MNNLNKFNFYFYIDNNFYIKSKNTIFELKFKNQITLNFFLLESLILLYTLSLEKNFILNKFKIINLFNFYKYNLIGFNQRYKKKIIKNCCWFFFFDNNCFKQKKKNYLLELNFEFFCKSFNLINLRKIQ